MFKKVVSEEEFLDLCNQELRRHPDFEEGMKITGLPLNATFSDPQGYQWDGPRATERLIPEVVSKVQEQYEFHVRPEPDNRLE